MSLGKTPRQRDLFRSTIGFCAPRLPETSAYGFLHRECFTLFPDEMFADLFAEAGRWSVPPLVVAVVMVLQRLEDLSDREAVERFTFDLRCLDMDYPGFVHTVLVDMRARLAASDQPNRIFDVTLEVGRQAGLVNRRRVLDSTPIYDAVATMDTVTLVRSAIRRLLRVAGDLEPELRAVLRRDDAYVRAGKPVCDYDDPEAREAVVDALAKDGRAVLRVLDGRALPASLEEAARVLAAVLGPDLDQGDDGVFRIARRVAADRIVSTVDPEARHGHKTAERRFDGYKGHIALAPDSEIITATAVTAGNAGDATAVAELLANDLAVTSDQVEGAVEPPEDERLVVYGDAAYGAGEVLSLLDEAKAVNRCKVQPPTAPAEHFPKQAFAIDLEGGTVTCPAGQTVPLVPDGTGAVARFGRACADCPLMAQCTTAKHGRSISVGPHEAHLAHARAEQADPAWQADYRATRPKVERKIAHLMHRHHGGRRARVRGQPKVAADFNLLAAAVNLARLALLRVSGVGGTWAVQAA